MKDPIYKLWGCYVAVMMVAAHVLPGGISGGIVFAVALSGFFVGRYSVTAGCLGK